ncbi:hypothetical protein DFS34DRAFT_591104 [Phlyctochytrium arcticum]|nr:hypothetical protein DFS34DRAFT_591104 [Phlyctochytrium arcticum]
MPERLSLPASTHHGYVWAMNPYPRQHSWSSPGYAADPLLLVDEATVASIEACKRRVTQRVTGSTRAGGGNGIRTSRSQPGEGNGLSGLTATGMVPGYSPTSKTSAATFDAQPAPLSPAGMAAAATLVRMGSDLTSSVEPGIRRSRSRTVAPLISPVELMSMDGARTLRTADDMMDPQPSLAGVLTSLPSSTLLGEYHANYNYSRQRQAAKQEPAPLPVQIRPILLPSPTTMTAESSFPPVESRMGPAQLHRRQRSVPLDSGLDVHGWESDNLANEFASTRRSNQSAHSFNAQAKETLPSVTPLDSPPIDIALSRASMGSSGFLPAMPPRNARGAWSATLWDNDNLDTHESEADVTIFPGARSRIISPLAAPVATPEPFFITRTSLQNAVSTESNLRAAYLKHGDREQAPPTETSDRRRQRRVSLDAGVQDVIDEGEDSVEHDQNVRREYRNWREKRALTKPPVNSPVTPRSTSITSVSSLDSSASKLPAPGSLKDGSASPMRISNSSLIRVQRTQTRRGSLPSSSATSAPLAVNGPSYVAQPSAQFGDASYFPKHERVAGRRVKDRVNDVMVDLGDSRATSWQ